LGGVVEVKATRHLVSTKREVNWLVLLFVLAFTFLHYVALSQRLDIMATVRNELLLGLVCMLCAIGTMLGDPMSLGAGKRVALSFGVFFALVTIQVPFAMDPLSASYAFNEWVLKQSLFTFYVAILLRSPRHIALFLATYLLALTHILQEAVRGLISGSLVWRNQGIQRLHGAVDRYRHPNGLSLAAVSCLPFLYYMREVWTKWWMRLAILGCLGLAVLCIINTGSRAGYVGVVAGVISLWLTRPKKLRNALVVIVLAAVAMLMVPDQYKQRFQTIGGDEIEGASQEARITLMKDAWEIFLAYPYGIGLNSFIHVRLQMFDGRKGQDVHNLYLQILTHVGIQGLVAFIWLIVNLFHCHEKSLKSVLTAAAGLRQGVRQHEIPEDRFVRRFLLDLRILEMSIRGIRFFTVMMLFNGIFAHTVYHILWYFIVGVSIATASTAEHLVEVTRQFWLKQQREAMQQ
jgi:putative inorganic carbon (hco3(-)) transporter